jgi:hypothetical protein
MSGVAHGVCRGSNVRVFACADSGNAVAVLKSAVAIITRVPSTAQEVRHCSEPAMSFP